MPHIKKPFDERKKGTQQKRCETDKLKAREFEPIRQTSYADLCYVTSQYDDFNIPCFLCLKKVNKCSQFKRLFPLEIFHVSAERKFKTNKTCSQRIFQFYILSCMHLFSSLFSLFDFKSYIFFLFSLF